ncbi:argonaute PAZ domain-containing protein [Gloeothece verrucosa]|uniref:Protein argonaute n=1 Tax=Gloeothece verrucosa (strain PCC 7822) TaxID=497965 RepID=E0UCX3_GLOV7|nr:argonaute PAZ domain-containing protein [Gloeothece verrucosa]ADN16438.1 stem cell self-renewal protein Piwi domain protein [Gloeothece verrucosa PCC 7822]
MNLNSNAEVFLNSFPLKRLSEQDRTVQVYKYNFKQSPEAGKEYSAISSICWKVNTPATRFQETIITKEKIAPEFLNNDNWSLQDQGAQVLDTSNKSENEALKRLEKRWLEQKIKKSFKSSKIERDTQSCLIWWNAEKVILSNLGWEVHTGVCLDILINSGALFIEIDDHHIFYSLWKLNKWLNSGYKNLPIEYVRNTYDDQTWKYARVSDEKPETVMIPGLGMSLADYHRNHKKYPATQEEIKNSHVVYVKNNNGQEIAHLSSRLRPSITMEILSNLVKFGDKEAAKVFNQVRKSAQARFSKAEEVIQKIAEKIYSLPTRSYKPQKTNGVLLRNKTPLLLTKKSNIRKPEASLKQGCLRTGEQKFGCLSLIDSNIWPNLIKNKLQLAAKSSDVEIILEEPKIKKDLPDSSLSRRQFWQNWADEGTNTVLVVSNWLGNNEKTQLRREALEANIALQFMQPMFKQEDYRAVNIVLGLLLKAKWQPVGLEPLQHEQAAELVIGFDAGTNRSLYYGTSAFAVLANGQSLGWELPEAQPGERLSGQAVLRATLNIVDRFQKLEKRPPKRLLLLRDGFVQRDEFDSTIAELKQENISVDLLGVRKSGAGRMALSYSPSPTELPQLKDAPPGMAIFSQDGKTFKIVTSEAKAGGSARPLQIFRDTGDAPLEVLAQQIDRLTMLNPASGYFYSRLPMVLHFADKMAKEVQRLGQIAFLQKVEREKIFFA